jgi:AcrR family transcriptional regulator
MVDNDWTSKGKIGTKDRILEAALAEFSTRGYDGASVDAIAQRASANKAMIYYHFPGKEALFEAVFERELDTVKNGLAAILGDARPLSAEEAETATERSLELIRGKIGFVSILFSGLSARKFIQPRLFDLLDYTTALGMRYEGSAKTNDEPSDLAIIRELFTGLLPLLGVVLLEEGLAEHYGWTKERVRELFLKVWLRWPSGANQELEED